MTVPLKHLVKVRVISPETGDALPLIDEVRALVGSRRRGAIELFGPPGSGKTRAIEQLAAAKLPHERLLLIDDGHADYIRVASQTHLVIYSIRSRLSGVPEVSLRLAGWTDDELIEYLLGAYGDRVGEVMSRLQMDEERRLLQGSPELWCLVLDRMASDSSLRSVRETVSAELSREIAGPDERRTVAEYCFALICGDELLAHRIHADLVHRHASPRLIRLAQFRFVQRLLAVERVIQAIDNDNPYRLVDTGLPADLLEEAGLQVAAQRPRVAQLIRWTESGHPLRLQPLAAGLLHAAGVAWRPTSPPPPYLSGARLTAASWPGVNLAQATLRHADFAHADLSRADLFSCDLIQARLKHASLPRARLACAKANEADFTGADAKHVHAKSVLLRRARLLRSDWSGADLREAQLAEADLRYTSFRAADLSNADLTGCWFERTDFRNAILRKARLLGASLSTCRLEGARLSEAELPGADLEWLELGQVDLQGADLREAAMTGTQLQKANLRAAVLCNAKLADIDWEDADLRDVDLRGCTFGSGIGRDALPDLPDFTRPGPFADENDAQYYRPPEEIRRANLSGADLRGARVDGVDFYLVDLRRAKYDERQGQHFRRCGAILFDRCD